MSATMDPRRASQVLRTLWQAILLQLRETVDVGMRRAQGRAVNKYMEGGAAGATSAIGMNRGKIPAKYTPANPPPGPLKIRSGTLRRTITIVKAIMMAGNVLKGGIKGGSSKVKYMRIHELGGTVQIPAITAKPGGVLAWPVGTRMVGRGKGLHPAKPGKSGFMYAYAKHVKAHSVRIAARPVLGPALKEELPQIRKDVDHDLKTVAERLGL